MNFDKTAMPAAKITEIHMQVCVYGPSDPSRLYSCTYLYCTCSSYLLLLYIECAANWYTHNVTQ